MPRKPKHTVTIREKPVPKGRPRMTRRGRVFTPIRTLEAEAVIREAWTGPCHDGTVTLDVRFYADGLTVTVAPSAVPQSELRGDLDNYVKLVMDGLNGVAWNDDKQVVSIKAAKTKGKMP
jgi:crossover junction endodeoxyribonuclease RusA